MFQCRRMVCGARKMCCSGCRVKPSSSGMSSSSRGKWLPAPFPCAADNQAGGQEPKPPIDLDAITKNKVKQTNIAVQTPVNTTTLGRRRTEVPLPSMVGWCLRWTPQPREDAVLSQSQPWRGEKFKEVKRLVQGAWGRMCVQKELHHTLQREKTWCNVPHKVCT